MPETPPPTGTVAPNTTIGTTPGLSAEQLRGKQADALADDLVRQKALQAAADKAAKQIFKRVQNKTIGRGSLISFQYSFYKHDFTPLCLVGRIWSGKYAGMISGLNLHYLTFRYIKYLINAYCGKNFQYQLIKGDKYIVNAYRSYKREGRKQVKMIDCEFINQMLTKARSFKPGEVENIRNEIQKQLKEKFHPKAEDIAKEYQEAIYRQGHKEYNIGKDQPDARFNPNPTNVQAPPEEGLQ
jgi:hypothetical protein